MKNIFLAAAAASILASVPALANEIRLTDTLGTGPVIIRGNKVVSDVQPIDMQLTPVPGSNYAYTNRAGQIVIKTPRFSSINITRN